MATLQRTAEETRMKAIVQDRYGPPSALRLREVDRPVPAAGEVLVRVRAAAVNALDWHFVRGDPYLARLSLGLRRPSIPVRGRDFAGLVDAIGRKPANLSFEQAAAIPLAGVTALMGVRDAAGIHKGQTILINGASGGVGLYAVQLAKEY